MKPLPAANLTDEDCLALVFVTIHRNKSIAAMTIRHAMCLESDRRDAELMLALAEMGPLVKGRAWAHRMLRSIVNPVDGIYINGYWVYLG